MPELNFNFNATDDNYTAPEFIASDVITKMHNHIPRWGKTNDILTLLEGTDDEKQDYVIGLLVLSVIILSVFTAWSLTIIILKCCGQRVGCASGMPKRPNGNGNDDENNDDENDPYYQELVHQAERSLFWTRVIFLLAGCGAIGSSVAFVYYGVESLKDSIDSVGHSLDGVEGIVDDTIDITELFVDGYNATQSAKEQIDTDEYNWCPVLYETPYDDLAPVLQEVKELTDAAAESVSQLRSGTVEQVLILQDDLLLVKDSLHKVDESMDAVDIVFSVALALALFQSFLTLAMMIGVMMAWCKRLSTPFRWLQSYLFLPIFMTSVLLSIIFSVVFVVGAVTGSDFCYPEPNDQVTAVLDSFKEQIGSVAFTVIIYYIQGCPTDISGVLGLDSYASLVVDAFHSVHNLTDALATYDLTIIEQLCGESNVTLIVDAASFLHDVIHAFVGTMDLTRKIFYCRTFNSIYTELVYDAVCQYGVSSLYGIYISQLCIAIFSMIMVTLRVSWQNVE